MGVTIESEEVRCEVCQVLFFRDIGSRDTCCQPCFDKAMGFG